MELKKGTGYGASDSYVLSIAEFRMIVAHDRLTQARGIMRHMEMHHLKDVEHLAKTAKNLLELTRSGPHWPPLLSERLVASAIDLVINEAVERVDHPRSLKPEQVILYREGFIFKRGGCSWFPMDIVLAGYMEDRFELAMLDGLSLFSAIFSQPAARLAEALCPSDLWSQRPR